MVGCHGEQTRIFQSLCALLTILLILQATKDGSNIGGFAELRLAKSWSLSEEFNVEDSPPLLFRR